MRNSENLKSKANKNKKNLLGHAHSSYPLNHLSIDYLWKEWKKPEFRLKRKKDCSKSMKKRRWRKLWRKEKIKEGKVRNTKNHKKKNVSKKKCRNGSRKRKRENSKDYSRCGVINQFLVLRGDMNWWPKSMNTTCYYRFWNKKKRSLSREANVTKDTLLMRYVISRGNIKEDKSKEWVQDQENPSKIGHMCLLPFNPGCITSFKRRRLSKD